MRTRGMTAVMVALGVAGATGSCGLIGGLDTFHFDGGPGGATGSASATTSGSSTEDCTNGIDDDDDGLVDCADPACGATGYACAGAVPAGWSGPFELYEGPETTSPACPAESPQAVFQGGWDPKGASAMCDPCTCGSPPSACSSIQLQCYDDSSCSSGSDVGTSLLQPGACGPVASGTSSVKRQGSSMLLGAACSPDGGVVHAPPIAWKRVALACGGAAIGGGCSAGEVCAPPTAAPFSTGWCIGQAGTTSCPGGYPSTHALVKVVDMRGCTACTCGSPADKCVATTALFSDAACQTQVGQVNTNSCVQTGAVAALVTATASCPASGGAPTGSITTTPWTLCCAL